MTATTYTNVQRSGSLIQAPLLGARRTMRSLVILGLAALGLAPSPAAAQETGYAAYTVYTYNGGPQGMAGRIRDTGTAITALRNLRTGLNGDPQVEGVMSTPTALRIAVTNRVAAPGAVPATHIYNATTAGSPAPLASPTWSNVRNMRGLVRVGAYLYALDYDNARIVEINRSNFQETGVTYTLPANLTPEGFTAYGQALVTVGGKLYGLFTFTDSSFSTYARSLLVRFTIQGGSSITVGPRDYNAKLVKNAFALAARGPDIYVAGIGGPQNGGSYSKASRLQKILHGSANLRTAEVTDVLKPSKQNPYEIRDISFRGNRAYVLLGAYDSGFTLQGKLVSTTDFAALKTVDDFTSGAPGYFWGAQYTPQNNRLWYARGNEIRVYTATNPATLVQTLTLAPGSLIAAGDPYDNINDFAYVGSEGSAVAIRGYRSPVQVSQSPRGQASRAAAQGRPELSAGERKRVDEELSGKSAD